MDRELLEARLREIAASAASTKAAAEALLRELAEVAPGGGAAGSQPRHIPTGDPTPRRGDEPQQPSGDEAAARLVVMKLALDGVPREDAVKRVSDDFGIANPESLVDDVYARADAPPA